MSKYEDSNVNETNFDVNSWGVENMESYEEAEVIETKKKAEKENVVYEEQPIESASVLNKNKWYIFNALFFPIVIACTLAILVNGIGNVYFEVGDYSNWFANIYDPFCLRWGMYFGDVMSVIPICLMMSMPFWKLNKKATKIVSGIFAALFVLIYYWVNNNLISKIDVTGANIMLVFLALGIALYLINMFKTKKIKTKVITNVFSSIILFVCIPSVGAFVGNYILQIYSFWC